jgi:hypothetical protein
MVEQNYRIFPFLHVGMSGIGTKLFFGNNRRLRHLILRFNAYLFWGFSVPYIATWQSYCCYWRNKIRSYWCRIASSSMKIMPSRKNKRLCNFLKGPTNAPGFINEFYYIVITDMFRQLVWPFSWWKKENALFLYSCTRHHEDGHMRCRNMSLITM